MACLETVLLTVSLFYPDMFSLLLQFVSPCVRINGLTNVPVPSACTSVMPGCTACSTENDCSQCDNGKTAKSQCTGK